MTSLQIIPLDFYSTVKNRCKKIIDDAIADQTSYVQILIKEVITPYSCYSPKQFDIIYSDLTAHYWNMHSVSVHFGGNNDGNGVSIDYTLYPTHVDDIKSMTDKAIQQLMAMSSGDTQKAEFAKELILLGSEWSSLMRGISQQLEAQLLGKIIMKGNQYYLFKGL